MFDKDACRGLGSESMTESASLSLSDERLKMPTERVVVYIPAIQHGCMGYRVCTVIISPAKALEKWLL